MRITISTLFFIVSILIISCTNDKNIVNEYMLQNVIDDPDGFEVTKVQLTDTISKTKYLIDNANNRKKEILQLAKEHNFDSLFILYKRNKGKLSKWKFKDILRNSNPKEFKSIDSILMSKYNFLILGKYFDINKTEDTLLIYIKNSNLKKEFDSLNEIISKTSVSNDNSPYIYIGYAKARYKDKNGKLKLHKHIFRMNTKRKIIYFD